ncbi:MAG: methyltransferase domain-containing protein [Actinomycetota bacterium]
MTGPDRYAGFPPGFFDRSDDTDDGRFYAQPRLVTHIDDTAITAVGHVYDELGIGGRVLDLMGSWVSHFHTTPEALVVAGRNGPELARNPQAMAGIVCDLNRTPSLPFADGAFDGATCCVSVDYLVRPLEVFDEVARVLAPGAVFCCTFSNRCFPTKAIAGWLATADRDHVELVGRYFHLSGPWVDVNAALAPGTGQGSDPLFAVWARRAAAD